MGKETRKRKKEAELPPATLRCTDGKVYRVMTDIPQDIIQKLCENYRLVEEAAKNIAETR
ncbi:hypothetical protein [Bacteroides heparinolyticus]|uniref:hypothetical protein n=1 Tax=Prevotella heparinolytica TaxID=28113 RepID=UPI0028E8BA20|nr:hypothetical protein [Bacteroides heparinolyticus]